MSDFERWILDGLDFNDLETLSIEGDTFSFKPAQKQAQWIDNPDADGAALAYEPNFTNATFAFTVRVEPQVSMDAALAEHGAVVDKLQKCSRMRDQGGLPGIWTPAGSTGEWEFFAELGELGELPITPTGDLAGWFLNSPLLPCTVTCKPFLKRSERQVVAPTSSELPVQVVEIPGVGGDVPAEARIVFTDKASQNRRHVELGVDQGEGSLLITATALSTTGYSGSVTTRSGAYSSEKVVRATAVNEWTTIAVTEPLGLLGSYRLKLRVYATSDAAWFRATYRVGDGPWKSLVGVQPPVVNNWCEIDLGSISVEEVANGTQRLEIRLDHRATEGAPANDVNYLIPMPATVGWGKGRGLVSNTPTKLLGYDNYEQTEGFLAGKASPLGGNWSGAGDAVDFKVIAASKCLRRTEVSDANLDTGRYAVLGSTSFATSQASVLARLPLSVGMEILPMRFGPLIRYIDSENWLGAFITAETLLKGFVALEVLARVGGVTTPLGRDLLPLSDAAAVTLSILATASGQWRGSAGAAEVEGFDSRLATGGTLAEGKGGIYDAWTSASALTREYDGFTLLATDPTGVVCYSGRSAEVRSDDDDPLQRQDSTGTYYGPPSTYRGDRLYIPPAGDSEEIARLAVKARRNDVDLEPDTNVTDKQQLEVLVTERFLAPR